MKALYFKIYHPGSINLFIQKLAIQPKFVAPRELCNLVPRVSHLTAPWSERREGLSSLAPGGGKMRDPGNEVGEL